MVRKFSDLPGIEWVEGTGDFITVDQDKCTGCGNCVKVCLAKCYVIVEKKSRIRDLEKCMECGACWYSCTDDAIRFSWPAGGTGFRTNWG